MTEKAEETGGKGPASLDLQMDRAHPARVYDYFLGGKDNFPADRELGDLIAAVTPEMRDTAHINRSFMVRAVKYVAECGVDQFLDLGTGIPTSPNTHEVAQSVIPGAHVVYVDNDPIVSVHGRALLATDSTTALVQADIRDIDRLLEEPKLRQLIDFSRPVAIMLVAVLHYVTDEDDPGRIVSRLLQEAAPGSYLILSHFSADMSPRAHQVVELAARDGVAMRARSREEIAEFFTGLEMVEPGLVLPPLWRPDGPVPSDLSNAWGYAGVARKN
ncbi:MULTISPECIES: SAM-dependent methyltransferase [Thermomonospora]|uniref:SAM-dependent methyltransferase n=1 Tax=Thermomonospora curvata (strain ATCC 19995 / DSM 43183 / JCM 3096 / KCTC 9072 / NBRC 15933 / NCIMB 10081 / Henssen B9) TaxID=471852 RepID=D1AAN1_THECD|nr:MULTISPECIES: SAM-dependent methyltransferase [Thermomonospora]ACY97041.1 protein of unknown function DUF574 [Thermomonospora curvata DSM 43183]PKK14916.1 MAG: methyltransferase [Thermomonospora sp. CIF 1]